MRAKRWSINMRQGEWAESVPISGTECVGIVKACPGGEFAVDSKVVAFMAPVKEWNPLLQMVGGAYLTFFGSFHFGTPGFPASNVPLQDIAAQAEAGKFDAKPARVFQFEDIREAHRTMESNEAAGKVVVVVKQ